MLQTSSLTVELIQAIASSFKNTVRRKAIGLREASMSCAEMKSAYASMVLSGAGPRISFTMFISS